ncbi:TonB-dependent Receptor Plug Domain [Opitutus sp. GAS368]|nr:TonB-dependent Receptor Plug Domain [Opitutus sp. GAS368]
MHAQTAAAPAAATSAEKDDIVVLSPFEVKSTSDSKAYTADSTLAGNRLNTQLRDIGSSLTVVTSQFLLDTGATDNTSLLQRLGGTEVGGVNGNFASAGSGSSATLLTEDTIKPTEGTRIRGLAAADNVRDFFVTDIPWDSYNVDRIDISRGPNAILFGEGSPAGIINATSKSAAFINSGNIDFRLGSWGSTRESLDINQVIVPGQVAVRLDLLHNDQKYEQKPAYSKDQRISGALRIEPAFLNKNGNRTIFKANFESGQVDSDNPRALPPTDHITPWFDPTALVNGIPGSGAYQAGLNGAQSWNSGVAGGFSTAANGYSDAGRAEGAKNPDPWFTNGQLGNAGFPLNVIQNGNTVGSAGQYRFTSFNQNSRAGTLITLPYGSYPSSWLSLNGKAKEAVFAGLPFSNGGLFTDTSLTDPSIFNFYKNLIDGNMKKEWQRFWTGSANLSQTFLNDQVGFSLDYNKQHYEDGSVNPFGGAVPLFVDVMSTNNDGTSLATASANPNFGRPFVINNNNPTDFNYISDREDTRATAFVTHNFKKDSNAWWATILGTQTLTGLADQAKLNTSTMSWQQYGYLGANLALANTLNGGSALSNFSQVNPQQVIYLGPSLTGKPIIGANISRVTGNPTIGSNPINYFDLTPNPANSGLSPSNPAFYNGWAGTGTLTVTDSEANPSVNRALLATAYGKTRSVTTSQALVYEGNWLDGALVGIYGWRKDINKSSADSATLGDANDQQSINLQNVSLDIPGATPGRVEVQSRSYSLVAHLDELPGLKDFASKLPVKISVAYNVSSNFQPDSSRVDINGAPLAPPSGKTIERGILLETRDGRFSLKVNRYVTTIANGEYAGGRAFAADLANFVGNTAYFANAFYYHNDQNGNFAQSDPAHMVNNPGIGPDGGPLGAGKYPNDNTAAGYYYDAAGYHTQAMEDLQNSSTAATRAWETQINADFPNFFKNWGMNSLAAVQAGTVLRSQLTGIPGETNFALTENSESKGWEMELNANPTKEWRISFNATKTDAVITTVGDPALAKFMAETSAYVKGPGGNTQWFWGNSISPGVPAVKDAYYNNYNGFAPLGTTYAGLQQQQGVAVPQLAKWRYNLTTNYDFNRGVLKGVNVGGGVRYSSAETLGYAPSGTGLNPDGTLASPPFLADLSKPQKSPSETYFDLWVGYHRKLTNKINWNIQLNVANVGKGNYLIPVSYQAPINGVASPAFYRIGPTQQFTIKNVFSF